MLYGENMSLRKFDFETNSVLQTGCATAEEEAIRRYGLLWRETYLEKRLCLRREQYFMLNWLFPYNQAIQPTYYAGG